MRKNINEYLADMYCTIMHMEAKFKYDILLQAAMEDRDRLLSLLMMLLVLVGQVRGIHVTTRSEDSLVREGEVESYITLTALSTHLARP